MNISYLMQHISRQLHTIVRQFSTGGKLLNTICERLYFDDNLEQRLLIKAFLLQTPENEFPKISMGAFSITYATITAPDYVFLIGPVILPAQAISKFCLPEYPCDHSWLETIYHCELSNLIQETLLLHNLFREDSITSSDIITFNYVQEKTEYELQKHFLNIVIQNQENGEKHNPYDQELREFSSIRRGDTNQLKKSWDEDYIGNIGTLAKDKLRHHKNLGIVLVTLASRAARVTTETK